MKIQRSDNGKLVELYAERKDDHEYLTRMIEYANVRETLYIKFEQLRGRLSATQATMHKSNLELVKIKHSWIYRVLTFISNNFSLTKPRGCK